jgi:hypothetical protein
MAFASILWKGDMLVLSGREGGESLVVSAMLASTNGNTGSLSAKSFDRGTPRLSGESVNVTW